MHIYITFFIFMLLAYWLGRVEGMMKIFYLIEKEQWHPIFKFVGIRFPEMAIKINRMAEKYDNKNR